MLQDDLPWPELGNVSRGATRGNQGQKGVLSPPDRDGKCTLQLRVQPGVLAVRLNLQASEWYHVLDTEVNRALKLTKTYWRKARRRQDYDARADQDHMELHEWLQQLKDKTMSHLELLMQKGDIQGPPYNMADGIELSFLRKFIERHNAGVPHNPRLRQNGVVGHVPNAQSPTTSPEPDRPGSRGVHSNGAGVVGGFKTEGASSGSSPRFQPTNPGPARIGNLRPISPSMYEYDHLIHEANSSTGHVLTGARATLARAQRETQDAFIRYTACLDAEQRARQEVAVAEQRRDELMLGLLSRNDSSAEGAPGPSRHSSDSPHDTRGMAEIPFHQGQTQQGQDGRGGKSLGWSEGGGSFLPPPPPDDSRGKRPRDWEQRPGEIHEGHEGGPVGMYAPSDRTAPLDGRYEDNASLPPRKRFHPMAGSSSFDVLTAVAQNMLPV